VTPPTLRDRLHEIIFEADTPAGRLFDTVLIAAIIASIAVVLLESVTHIRARHGSILVALEWGFTVLFTIEYVLRLYSVHRPLRYARSFFGVVDLLAIIPTYASILIPGAQGLLVIRILRLLRIFRVFKLVSYLNESRMLVAAIRASGRKIAVFLFTLFTIVVILGAVMYVIEGPEYGFTSIPESIYWAIVTLTTVGYGDIVPVSVGGKLVATVVMLLGYGIIAVPTGIVTAEMTRVIRGEVSTQACPSCGAEGHQYDAKHCRRCGKPLHRE
jgi:voltage-gated potassium channel